MKPSDKLLADQRAWLLAQVISEVQKTRAFCTIVIKVEDGVMKRVERTESLLPPTGREGPQPQ